LQRRAKELGYELKKVEAITSLRVVQLPKL
jgi:hypothetical protein